MNFFRSSSPKELPKGYIYSGQDKDDRFWRAMPGDVIKNGNKNPPWIVVNHTLSSITLTRWPGRLLEAEILNAADELEMNSKLRKDAGYTRTAGVRILRELPLEIIFGINGKQMCTLADHTRAITLVQLFALAQLPAHHARKLYAKAWHRWIVRQVPNSSHLKTRHYNTLELAPDNSTYGSPVAQGLSLVSDQFDQRAYELFGEKSFRKDQSGEEFMIPLLRRARIRLLFAAMSFAPGDLLTPDENDILAAAYKKVFDETK